jgi:hypothetical protein
MNDETNPPEEGTLYRNWGFLQRIDEDLRPLAELYGLPLEQVPDDLSRSE